MTPAAQHLSRTESHPDRLAGTIVVLVAGLAWAALLLHAGSTMQPETMLLQRGLPGLPAYLTMWGVMMSAMMLPSVAPFTAVVTGFYRKAHGGAWLSVLLVLVFAYLAVWTATAALPLATHVVMNNLTVPHTGVVVTGLLAAAAYQMTPLKATCLRRCRSPMFFLFRYYRPGVVGLVRLSVAHALWCLACCIGLMLTLVVLGAHNLLLTATVAAVIWAEKLVPGRHRRGTTVLTGLALLVAAAAVATGILGT